MPRTRTQKRYASVLGACLLALAADRLFLAPEQAEAVTSAPTPPPPAPPSRTVPPVLASQKPIAALFATIAEERGIDPTKVPDAFRVPTAWLPRQGPSGSAWDRPDAERFRAAHRLNAVMALESGGYAIVDGRRLRVGQEIDGFRLVEIRVRSIVLESAGLQIELTLSDTGGAGP